MARMCLASLPNQGELYVIQPGDNLTKIVQEARGMSLANPQSAIQQILQDNPHIADPNRIFPGQLLFVRTTLRSANITSPRAVGTSVADDARNANRTFQELSGGEKTFAQSVAPMAWLATKESTSMALSHLRSSTNQFRTHLQGILEVDLPDRQAGKITSQQFLHRTMAAQAFGVNDMGPMKYALGRQPLDMLKFESGQGRTVHQTLTGQIDRLSTLAKTAKGGLVLVNVVDAGVVCYNIARETDAAKKSGLFVSWAGGTAGSVTTGIVATLLVSNPIGWKVGIAIGVASAVGGLAASWSAKKVYDTYGNSYDVAGALHIDEICTPQFLPVM